MALEDYVSECVHARACAHGHSGGREVGDIAFFLKILHQTWKHPFTLCYFVDFIFGGSLWYRAEV